MTGAEEAVITCRYAAGVWHQEYWREKDCHTVVKWKDYAGTESLIQVFRMGHRG